MRRSFVSRPEPPRKETERLEAEHRKAERGRRVRLVLAVCLAVFLGIGGYLIYLPLRPLADLAVETDPPGAAISLDGGPALRAPNTFRNVPFGGRRLTATLEGYFPTQQDLQFDGAKALKIVLTPDADAMYKLGKMYYHDAQDYAQARDWFQKAAEAGNATAMNNLGELYYYGRGAAKDYAKAGEWYQKAAEAGNPDAMYNLGVLYQSGRGVAQDYAKAREWFLRPPMPATRTPCNNSGVMYQNGRGVAQDYAKAREWFPA